MKSAFQFLIIFSIVLLTFQFDFFIYDWQWLTIDEVYVELDHAVVTERNIFSIKASLIKPLDYTAVSW